MRWKIILCHTSNFSCTMHNVFRIFWNQHTHTNINIMIIWEKNVLSHFQISLLNYSFCCILFPNAILHPDGIAPRCFFLLRKSNSPTTKFFYTNNWSVNIPKFHTKIKMCTKRKKNFGGWIITEIRCIFCWKLPTWNVTLTPFQS